MISADPNDDDSVSALCSALDATGVPNIVFRNNGIMELITCFSALNLFLSNDTGAMHLTAFIGTRVVHCSVLRTLGSGHRRIPEAW